MFDKKAKETPNPKPCPPSRLAELDILVRLRIVRASKIIITRQLEEEIGNIETQIAWHERHPEAEEIFSLFLERFGLSRP
jgi:hypothetical protein